jgi:hypothetical protein
MEMFRLDLPGDGGLPPERLRKITLTRAGGETMEIDAQSAGLSVSEVHPPVERMRDDWGAICEVFKNNTEYYVVLNGVALVPGDRITAWYTDRPAQLLEVVEVVNGRARIKAPVVIDD